MRTPIFIKTRNTGLSTSATNYTALVNSHTSGNWQSNENAAKTIMPADGTLSGLRVRIGTALTGSQTYTFTIRVAGSNSSVTCTVSSSGQDAFDITNSVSVSEGDEVTISCVPANTPASQTLVQISLYFDSDNPNESCNFGCFATSVAELYGQVGGFFSNATESNVAVPCSTAGTFNKIFIRLSAAPGTGTSKTFALRKNGSDTGLTCIVQNNSTSNNFDLSGSPITVAQGDILSIHLTVSGAVAASVAVVSFLFSPTVDGESMHFGASNGVMSATTSRYFAPGQGDTSTETDHVMPIPCTLSMRKLYALLGTAPTGSGKSRAFTLRTGTASSLSSTSLSTTITNTGTTNFNNTDEPSYSTGDFFTIQQVPTSSPSTSLGFFGFTTYVAPNANATGLGGPGMMGVG